MDNQQNQQDQQDLNPYEALDKLGKEVVDLKLSGLSYQHISDYLEKLGEKTENQTIRKWFMTGGKYHNIFEFMKQKRREDIEPEFAAIEEHIQEGAVDAIQVVREEVRKGSLKAAMYMLKLAGFEIEQVKNISGDVEGVELLKEILERNEKKDGQRPNSTHQTVQG